jgi:MoxR-like ATPase
MTSEHQLLISRTGMAKSFLVRQIFSCFENTHIFEKQFTKKTMPENLFGAYDIEIMKKGDMVYNVHGSLVLSHFAFLDNIFDANNLLLRSLLSLLNEKQIISSTLHSVIAASNHIRVKKAL